MEIKLNLSSTFLCVYLVNGALIEGGEIIFNQKEVVYITVLPLEAILLPYTVKMVGASVKSNNDLCRCVRLEDDKYFLKFSPRYSYVYSVPQTNQTPKKDIVETFFLLILQKNTAKARECLSRELSDSIENSSLASFFDGYEDIIPSNPAHGLYYLANSSGKGVLFNFVIKNNLIDNIIEL